VEFRALLHKGHRSTVNRANNFTFLPENFETRLLNHFRAVKNSKHVRRQDVLGLASELFSFKLLRRD